MRNFRKTSGKQPKSIMIYKKIVEMARLYFEGEPSEMSKGAIQAWCEDVEPESVELDFSPSRLQIKAKDGSYFKLDAGYVE